MAGYIYHREIGFSVKEIGASRWRWIVEPPSSVSGLKRKIGEVIGERADAVAAAKLEIERQDVRVN